MFTRLREDVAAIRERDPAARSAWEVLTCYPGLHALVFHRLAHACWRSGWRWLGRFVSQLGRFLTGIEIHPGATLGRRVFIDHGMGVVIGETAVIGDDCTIYQGVTLGGTSLARGAKRHPTLERGVIVGAGAKVLGGFTVGAGAKIGSNAVVVKPVPAGGTAVGNPARVVVPAEAKRTPERTAFCAYGITPNADDPMSLAIHGLIDHAAKEAQRVDEIVVALERLGAHLDALQGTDGARLDLRRLSAAFEGRALDGGRRPSAEQGATAPSAKAACLHAIAECGLACRWLLVARGRCRAKRRRRLSIAQAWGESAAFFARSGEGSNGATSAFFVARAGCAGWAPRSWRGLLDRFETASRPHPDRPARLTRTGATLNRGAARVFLPRRRADNRRVAGRGRAPNRAIPSARRLPRHAAPACACGRG